MNDKDNKGNTTNNNTYTCPNVTHMNLAIKCRANVTTTQPLAYQHDYSPFEHCQSHSPKLPDALSCSVAIPP